MHRRCDCVVAVAAVAATLACAEFATAGPPLFRAGFEAGLDAEESRGAAQATAAGTAQRAPDRHGTSLILGPGPGSCAYAAAANVDLRQGTAIAWLQPTGWQSGAGPAKTVLRARQGGGSLVLWWLPQGSSLLASHTLAGRTVTIAKPAYDWAQLGWHHVILTWSPDTLTLTVDGQTGSEPAATPPAVPEAPDGQLILGGEFGAGATLGLRGITVLAEAVSEQSIQDRYRLAVSGRAGHERPALVVGRCAKPPVIDGKLEPGEWDGAAGVSGFVEIGSGTLSGARTVVSLASDAANVYVAARCLSSAPPAGALHDRDTGSPWDEDCVELFLQPEVGFTGKYYHLIINAFGALWDAEDQNAGWGMAGTWAAAQGAGEWTAEVAVPFASLGTQPPDDGTAWQANLCRSVGGSGTTYRHTAWAYTGGSGYAVWQQFGTLRFRAASPVVRLETLTAQPAEGASLRLCLSNATGAAARLQAECLLYRAEVGEEFTEVSGGPWELKPGETRSVDCPAKAPYPVDQVVVRVRHLDSGDLLLSQMVRAGALTPVPATVVPPGPAGAGAAAVPPLTDEILGQVVRERAQWENNRLGITDTVPPPWSPLQVSGKVVTCWGRTYDFGGSLLPRQVQSQAADLLGGPMVLTVTVGDQALEFGRADQQSLVPAPNQVDLDARTAAAGLSVRVRSHLEYDGCVKIDLTLAPTDQPVVLTGLELQIPVKAERALYYHWFEATRDPRQTNAGALPKDGLKSHFKPLLWLGDDDRGLCWFSESPKGWAVRDKESVLAVERRADACVMRIRMADRPLVIAGPWTTVFGLMATPVRPMPPGWRDWLVPLNLSNPWGAWSTGLFNNLSGTDDPGTLMPKDWEAMKQATAASQALGPPVPYLPRREPQRVVPYSQIVFWSGKHRDGMPSPEIKVFGPEWSNQKRAPGPRVEPDEQIPLKEYYWVCPASSFAQYYLFRLNELIDRTGIDGIYIDGPWNTCANPLHGCGYLDDGGQWQPEYRIWPFRDLLKRVYCLFHEKRKTPLIHHHTSCWLSIPSLSFCHIMLDGEQYHDAGQKVEDHFLDIVPLDKWRAEHTGRQWGPAPFLLPDIPGPWCKPAAPTRELLLLTNLHDTGLYPAGNNTRLVMRNYEVRRLFGVGDCDFRGYWGSADWVQCATPECFVSVYRKPDGSRCLLVVGNTAKRDATAEVRPVFAGLKLQGGTADSGVDLESGERLAVEAGVLRVPVKARDYRLVALPAYTPPPITAGDLTATALREVANPGFEAGLTGWSSVPVEGNPGSVSPDRETRFAGTASCRLHKVDGPGGMMVQTDDVFRIEPGRKYRVDAQVRIANATGAKAYWMLSPTDAEGERVSTNNLFSGFLTENQEWKPLPFEFDPPAGTAVVRIHFLVAFPGTADVWIDDVRFEAVNP